MCTVCVTRFCCANLTDSASILSRTPGCFVQIYGFMNLDYSWYPVPRGALTDVGVWRRNNVAEKLMSDVRWCGFGVHVCCMLLWCGVMFCRCGCSY